MKRRMRAHRPGLTLIELMISMCVLALMIALVAPSYAMLRGSVALGNASRELQSALRLAQSRSAVSQDGITHGVRVESGYYVLFGGSWGATTYTTQFNLPSGVAVQTGAGQTILFTRLTGLPQVAQDVVLGGGSSTRTVRVDTGGLVSLP